MRCDNSQHPKMCDIAVCWDGHFVIHHYVKCAAIQRVAFIEIVKKVSIVIAIVDRRGPKYGTVDI
jgi:hypothetical protein